jgi:hypothetical protein
MTISKAEYDLEVARQKRILMAEAKVLKEEYPETTLDDMDKYFMIIQSKPQLALVVAAHPEVAGARSAAAL